MAKTRAQKEIDLQNLTEKLGKAHAVVLVDYQQAGTSSSKGMTMKQLSDLRDKLHDQNAEFSVTKNTLLTRALNSSQLSITDSQLIQGPIATLFAYDDEISPIKTLVKALKDNAIGQIKAGFLGSESLSATRVNQLSALPGKDELRGQVVGLIASPIKGIVGVLNANLRNLAVVINQIKIARGGE